MLNQIFPRDILPKIKKYLQTDDIIVLHGARQVGKTSILRYLINELEQKHQKTFYIDLENLQYLELLNSGPQNLIDHLQQQGFNLTKTLFLMIDEIQYLANPSNFLKIIHDHYPQIKLIVSGSSSFEIKSKFKDSLVGRTINFEIYPLSFSEFLNFHKLKIDLKKTIDSLTTQDLKKFYTEYIFFGGYPKIILTADYTVKADYLQQIIDTYIRKDIKDFANIKDILKFNKLLQVLADQSGKLLNVTELANTVGIVKKTIEHYLFILENTYIIKLVYPYAKNIRSELFKTPKIFFYDTGLMHILKHKTIPKVITGESFETSIFSELIKNFKKENLNYWRTQDKKEIDFIINENEPIPLEIKLNAVQIKMTALNYFLKKYNLKKWFCVSMEIQNKSKNFLFPWEIINNLSNRIIQKN